MANEATIRSSLQIQKGNLDYRSYPTQFQEDVAGSIGPTPGATLCAVAPGTDIDLSELTNPGLCKIHNIDSTNFVRVGVYDPESEIFYPFMKIKAGKFYIFQLAPDFGQEFATGTGTVGPETNKLRIIADTAACVVVVEAFEE